MWGISPFLSHVAKVARVGFQEPFTPSHVWLLLAVPVCLTVCAPLRYGLPLLSLRMFVDRVKLIMICQKPGAKKARQVKPKLVTTYLIVIVVLAAFVSFPNALVFISVGFDMGNCTVFGFKPPF